MQGVNKWRERYKESCTASGFSREQFRRELFQDIADNRSSLIQEARRKRLLVQGDQEQQPLQRSAEEEEAAACLADMKRVFRAQLLNVIPDYVWTADEDYLYREEYEVELYRDYLEAEESSTTTGTCTSEEKIKHAHAAGVLAASEDEDEEATILAAYEAAMEEVDRRERNPHFVPCPICDKADLELAFYLKDGLELTEQPVVEQHQRAATEVAGDQQTDLRLHCSSEDHSGCAFGRAQSNGGVSVASLLAMVQPIGAADGEHLGEVMNLVRDQLAEAVAQQRKSSGSFGKFVLVPRQISSTHTTLTTSSTNTEGQLLRVDEATGYEQRIF
mmetsp:Transcript_24490/g.61594  ORF Transcript_24490/g.61594 Transcript_24490/m.61594 type:complete len:331 (-) Transcript_24490:40-1032(-)|eukprot:g5601.t1